MIRIDLRDGTSLFPARVDRGDPHWQADLDDATDYYQSEYAGRGILSIEYAPRLSAIPLPNAATIRPWREVRETIGRRRDSATST